jgi:hypothetical protein
VNKVYGTFGQQLLNVRYGGEFNKSKAYLFVILMVGSRYLKQRSHEIATVTRNPSLSEKVRNMFGFIQSCVVMYNHVRIFLLERSLYTPHTSGCLVCKLN